MNKHISKISIDNIIRTESEKTFANNAYSHIFSVVICLAINSIIAMGLQVFNSVTSAFEIYATFTILIFSLIFWLMTFFKIRGFWMIPPILTLGSLLIRIEFIYMAGIGVFGLLIISKVGGLILGLIKR
jgi:hypothetical protein